MRSTVSTTASFKCAPILPTAGKHFLRRGDAAAAPPETRIGVDFPYRPPRRKATDQRLNFRHGLRARSAYLRLSFVLARSAGFASHTSPRPTWSRCSSTVRLTAGARNASLISRLSHAVDVIENRSQQQPSVEGRNGSPWLSRGRECGASAPLRGPSRGQGREYRDLRVLRRGRREPGLLPAGWDSARSTLKAANTG